VATPIDMAPLVERAFTLDITEQAQAPARITGALPPYVRGTCLLNGPARFVKGALRYRHWLDGDGMVAALTLGADGARITNRFVRSAKFVREQAEGRAVYRTFGTAFPGDELKRGVGLESPVNVSVYPFRGVLLAFGEQGLPWELDPVTLETRGLYTFGGQLNEITPFSAHAKIDHHTGELFNFGVSFSATKPELNVFRFSADGALVYRRRLPLPYPASIHDFAISERYVVFHVGPLVLQMEALLKGATLMESLAWKPELGSRIIVADRETGAHAATLDAGRGYCLHLVNAFDQAGRLVVDVVEYEKPVYPEYQVIPDLFTDTFQGHPVRFVVDPAAGAIVERRDLAYAASPDFPAHDPAATGRPYDAFWMLGISHSGSPGRKFFDHIVRIDWSTGQAETCMAPAGCYFGGEPCFIPDPAAPEARGVVLCQQLDPATLSSSFIAFDAFALGKGPIATIALPTPIPPLFHSTFHRDGGTLHG